MMSAEAQCRQRQPITNKTIQKTSLQQSAPQQQKSEQYLPKNCMSKHFIWPDKNRLEMTRTAMRGFVYFFFG